MSVYVNMFFQELLVRWHVGALAKGKLFLIST